MALLEIKGLNKNFGGIQAVSDCTFSVEEGRIVSLIGPNGAGKTTVFNLVTGLLTPDSGEVMFQGKEINQIATTRDHPKGDKPDISDHA